MGSGNRYHIYDADHIREMNIKETKTCRTSLLLKAKRRSSPVGEPLTLWRKSPDP